MSEDPPFRETTSEDTGSLYTGSMRVRVGDRLEIEGERRVRRVTYVMGSDRKGWYACFKGQGAVPRGRVRWRVLRVRDVSRVAEAVTPSYPPRDRGRGSAWTIMPLPRDTCRVPALLVTGFDSAWTASAHGAIASFVIGAAGVRLVREPRLVDFDAALELVDEVERAEHEATRHLIVIDEPLIVPNARGCRPVERALASVLGRHGGGVQPANRSRAAMFGPRAPIWTFLEQLSATLDPRRLFDEESPRRIAIEGFPALAFLGLFPELRERRSLPKYNPTRASFSEDDWTSAAVSLSATFAAIGATDAAAWCLAASERRPRKPDQDALDALVCALIGVVSALAPTTVTMIGDLQHGYVVAPCDEGAHDEIHAAGLAQRVPVSRLDDAAYGAPLRAWSSRPVHASASGSETAAPARGSRAALLAVLAGRSLVSPADVDELTARIAEGRRGAEFGSRIG